MENRCGISVEPRARKIEVGPRAGAEAKHIVIETHRPLDVVGQDGEVVHSRNSHGLFLVRWRGNSSYAI